MESTENKINKNISDNKVKLSQQLKILERKTNSAQSEMLNAISKTLNIFSPKAGDTLGLLGDFDKFSKERKKQEAKDIIEILENIELNSNSLSSLSLNKLDYLQERIKSAIPKINNQILEELNAKKTSNVVDAGPITIRINSEEKIKQLNLDSDERIDSYKESQKYFTDVIYNIMQEKNSRVGPPLPEDHQSSELPSFKSGFYDLSKYQQQTESLIEQQSIYRNLINSQEIGTDLTQEKLILLDQENQKIIANTIALNEFQKQQEIETEKKQRLKEGQTFVENFTLKDFEKVNKDENDQVNKLNEWYALSQELNINNQEILLEQEQLYQEAKLAIEDEYSEKRKKIIDEEQENRVQNQLELLDSASQLFGSMGDLIGAFGGESSGAYKAMFAISKGFSIANATLCLYDSIAKAMGQGFPENIPLIAKATTQGVQLISSIKSTNISGQAHAGIDYIPKEGTWLLDKGERVVDARTNADLKNFLQSPNTTKSGFNVNVPVTVSSGEVSEEEGRQLGTMIKQSVMSIIQEQQRPGGILNRY